MKQTYLYSNQHKKKIMEKGTIYNWVMTIRKWTGEDRSGKRGAGQIAS